MREETENAKMKGEGPKRTCREQAEGDDTGCEMEQQRPAKLVSPLFVKRSNVLHCKSTPVVVTLGQLQTFHSDSNVSPFFFDGEELFLGSKGYEEVINR